MIPETFVPVLLAVAGTTLAAAGLLIIAGRRRRAVTAVGAMVLLVGIVTISPTTASETAGTGLTATSKAIAGLTDRPGTDREALEPGPGELVAVVTPPAP